jgi:hypothetical protein
VRPDGGVIYHKKPIRSSRFVKRDEWRDVFKYNPNLLLAHARGASKGVGEPMFNKNNHPFTSLDKSIGLIHNGRVEDSEYRSLKKAYEVSSDCDSEVILRIIEAGSHYHPHEITEFINLDYPNRLAGIRDVYSFINSGHLAVAVGERNDENNRSLWLFRNAYRPLWIVDMRELLGQIFFVSEPGIWEESINECPSIRGHSKFQKLIELPPEEVWLIESTKEEPTPNKIKKYKVSKSKEISANEINKYFPLIEKQPSFEVISTISEEKETHQFFENNDWEELELKELESKCNKVSETVQEIKNWVKEKTTKQSIGKDEIDRISNLMNNQIDDMNKIVSILEN